MTPHPAPRRPAAGGLVMPSNIRIYLVCVVFAAVLISGVSAESLIDQSVDSKSYSFPSGTFAGAGPMDSLYVNDIAEWNGLNYVYFKTTGFYSSYGTTILTPNPYYEQPITLKISGTTVGTGRAYYNALYNAAGSVIGAQFWLEIDEFSPSGYTGKRQVDIIPASGTIFNGVRPNAIFTEVSDSKPISFNVEGTKSAVGDMIVRKNYYWTNTVDVDDYQVIVTREIGDYQYQSSLTVKYEEIILTDAGDKNINIPYVGSGNWTVVNPRGITYTGTFGGSSPTGPANTTVTIYVRSSQTGALLAGAHLLLEGAPGVDGWSDYYNGTLPSGSAEFSLPTTTEATPYQFRVTATYPGYTEVTPLQYFNTFRPRNVIIEMEPAAVAPTDPENTFLVFYVRDTSANPLPGAVIEVDDQWLYTNNNGYARFEVLKNATYPYKVSKSGYMTIQGSANVESEGSYTVNVVLGQGSVPSLTPTPTSTGWGEGQWTPDPDAGLGDNARGAAKSTLLQGFQLGQALFMITLLMVLMAVLRRGGK